jgi:hypothetical protein
MALSDSRESKFHSRSLLVHSRCGLRSKQSLTNLKALMFMWTLPSTTKRNAFFVATSLDPCGEFLMIPTPPISCFPLDACMLVNELLQVIALHPGLSDFAPPSPAKPSACRPRIFSSLGRQRLTGSGKGDGKCATGVADLLASFSL